jgi:hypothetical protein
MFIFRAILLLSTISVALLAGWPRSPHRKPFFQRLFLLVLLAWFVEAIGILTSELDVHNVVLYNVYAIVEFILLLDMVRLLRPRWWPGLCVAVILGLTSMVHTMIAHGPFGYLAMEGLLTLCLLGSLVFLLLLVDLARSSLVPLGKLPAFWVFTGTLVYFGGIIPVLGAWKFVGALDLERSQVLYWIVIGLAMVRYGLCAVAFQMERRGPAQSP